MHLIFSLFRVYLHNTPCWFIIYVFLGKMAHSHNCQWKDHIWPANNHLSLSPLNVMASLSLKVWYTRKMSTTHENSSIEVILKLMKYVNSWETQFRRNCILTSNTCAYKVIIQLFLVSSANNLIWNIRSCWKQTFLPISLRKKLNTYYDLWSSAEDSATSLVPGFILSPVFTYLSLSIAQIEHSSYLKNCLPFAST